MSKNMRLRILEACADTFSLRFAPFLLCFILGIAGCAKKSKPPEDVLAVVGDKYVTIHDFVKRAEFTSRPAIARVNGHSGNRALLEMLIAEKLVALEAERLRFNQRNDFQTQLRFIESQAALRELYEDEVLSKVEVSEEQILQAFDRMHKTLSIKFFYSHKQEDAERFRELVDQNDSFDAAMRFKFGQEVSEENYTAQLTWGEVDAALENTAYSLELHEVSPVIETTRGYFVIQLVNVIVNPLQTEGELLQKRNGITKIIRTRTADVQSSRFVRDFMKDKKLVIKGPIFAALCRGIEKHVKFSEDTTAALEMLPQESVSLSSNSLIEFWDEPLVTFTGGSYTLGDIVEGLRQRNIPLDKRSPARLRKTLSNDIFALARDKLLAQEGYRRSLQKRAGVRDDLRLWGDHFLYRLLAEEMGLKHDNPRVIEFSQGLRELQYAFPAEVDTARLRTIQLTEIPVLAVRPGQSNQLVVPPWPVLF